jgi:hypothetical protein
MKLRSSLLLAIIACVCLPAIARNSDKVVKVRAGQPSYKIKAGQSAPIEVVIEINSGYHINSNRPPDPNLIPTRLRLERLAGVTTTAVVYPKAKMQKFEFSEKPLPVFDGTAILKFNARALASAAAGNHALKGKLAVQACNDQQCLRPVTLDVTIPIEIVK